MTAPCRPGPNATQNKQQGQRKAVHLVKFLRKALNHCGFLAGWGQTPTITDYPEATREKWRREALKNEAGPCCDVVTIETTLSGSQEGQYLSSEQLTSY